MRRTSQSQGNRCWPGEILFFLLLVLALLTSRLSMRLPQWHLGAALACVARGPMQGNSRGARKRFWISRVLEPIPASKAAFRAGELIDNCPATGKSSSSDQASKYDVTNVTSCQGLQSKKGGRLAKTFSCAAQHCSDQRLPSFTIDRLETGFQVVGFTRYW